MVFLIRFLNENDSEWRAGQSFLQKRSNFNSAAEHVRCAICKACHNVELQDENVRKYGKRSVPRCRINLLNATTKLRNTM